MEPPPDTIRTKLEAGLLPDRVPLKTDATLGQGAACSACDQPIVPPEVQWNFLAGDVTYRFHINCTILWQIECGARRARRSADAA